MKPLAYAAFHSPQVWGISDAGLEDEMRWRAGTRIDASETESASDMVDTDAVEGDLGSGEVGTDLSLEADERRTEDTKDLILTSDGRRPSLPLRSDVNEGRRSGSAAWTDIKLRVGEESTW